MMLHGSSKFPGDPNCAQLGVLQGNLHPSSYGNAIKGLAPTFEIGRKALKSTWGFPKFRGTILGVPIIRTIVYWGLYWGTLILGNYHLARLKHVEDTAALALHALVGPGPQNFNSPGN